MAPVKPTVPPPNANYAGQPHEQLKGQVTNNYNPDTANAVIDAWKGIGDQFKELATDFSILVNGSQDGWRGRAAEGVRGALNKVGAFSDTTGDGFLKTAGAIEQQRDAAVQANTAMPEPVKFSPTSIMGKWGAASFISPVAMIGGPIELMQKHNEQKEAHQEAARVVQQRDNTMMAAAMSMPAMESTPQVTQDQGVTQTSSSTTSHSLSNVNANQRFSSNTGMPSTPPGTNNGTTNTAWVAPSAKDPNLPSNFDPNKPGNQNRPGFPGPGPGPFPPGRMPGGNTQGRPPGGGQGRPLGSGQGMRPGGPGGAGGRGMGPGGMGGPGAAGRGIGSFGPASPGGSAGVTGPGGGPAGSGAAGSGAAGRQGGAGAGAGGGQGGQGAEDKEHKSNYLVPTDEFFDDDRMVAPPVIGG